MTTAQPRRGELLALLRDLEALTLRLGSALDIPGARRLEMLEASRRASGLLSREEHGQVNPPRDGRAPSWYILHGDPQGVPHVQA